MFDSLFGGGIITKRVMEAVKAKIAVQEKRYEDGIIEIEERAEKEKVTLADTLVQEIIGKIL